jgi:hypothetical protein
MVNVLFLPKSRIEDFERAYDKLPNCPFVLLQLFCINEASANVR